MTITKNDYLRQLLQIHWLRPETALWRTFDCLLMEQYGRISGRAADLGCGDGTMSFIMGGGQIEGYDVFMETAELEAYNEGADIYNNLTQAPIKINSDSIRYCFDYGLDHKTGLISKAKRFSGFYNNTLTHDLNQPLPFPAGSFNSLFSNILYWLDDLDSILTSWHQALLSDGTLCLFVPTSKFKEKAWLYYSAPHEGRNKYLNYFDRGYGQLIHHCKSAKEWEAIFNRNGFSVADHHTYLSDPVMDIWNVGTRPIAPLLINLAKKLPAEDRLEVKEEWIDYFLHFFQPIIEGEFGKSIPEEQAGFHFFVLTKN